MLALPVVVGEANGATREVNRSGRRYALDVVVNDAALVEELDAGEEGAEPLFGMMFGDFDGDQTGVVGPWRIKKLS